MNARRTERSTHLSHALLLVGATALLLAGCGDSNPTSPEDEGIKVFILAGQSNMEGLGETRRVPEPFRQRPENVTLYLQGEPVGLLSEETFGPEVTFALARAATWPDSEIVLIKFASSGSSLFAWDPDWRWIEAALTENADVGSLYDRMLNQIETIVESLGGERAREEEVLFSGVLWMQGERDAMYPESAERYGENLDHFIDRLRSDLNTPDLPFVFGRINPEAELFPFVEAGRSAQEGTADRVPGTRMISTEGLSKMSDGVHYDTPGQLELGSRFDAGFSALVRAGVDPASW